MIGGPATVQKFINNIGIKDFVSKVNEAEMHQGFDIQRINTTTPSAATQLLKKFYSQNILSKKTTDFLYRIMTKTLTGKNRLKGQLPEGTLVAHKTGTSDTKEGVTIAVNDIGIVTLPDKKHFAISIFVSNSKESNDTNEKIISDITKLTWDYFLNNTK